MTYPSNESATALFINAPAVRCESYLLSLPAAEGLKERLRKLWEYTKYGLPEKVAGKYYLQKNDGLQNQAVLYRQDNNEGRPWCW